ncbi:MAG: tilS [Ilumatobacteraceae bacterium]|nr:tilS [Ilumatobacteraceae bacterium]
MSDGADLVAELLTRCPQLHAGEAVVCAVSGGPDSMALLVLATAAGCDVTAVHVDHGLREGSAAEAELVAAAAHRFGAAFRRETVHVEPGPNLEARARAVRHAVLGADALTGHTADDQAETMLINLLRGGALNGLSGMRPHRHPLLQVRRAETHALCSALGIAVVDDPTNHLPVHLRNRVRHELLPLMDALSRRDLVPLLTRQADVWRDDADLLDALAADLDPTDARALAQAPLPLARRAVRRWLAGEHPPDLATIERVLAVARGDAEACETNDGRRIARHRQRLSLDAPRLG